MTKPSKALFQMRQISSKRSVRYLKKQLRTAVSEQILVWNILKQPSFLKRMQDSKQRSNFLRCQVTRVVQYSPPQVPFRMSEWLEPPESWAVNSSVVGSCHALKFHIVQTPSKCNFRTIIEKRCKKKASSTQRTGFPLLWISRNDKSTRCSTKLPGFGDSWYV